MTDIEKRPGADWHVHYVDVADGSSEVMTVFGAVSVEAALTDAAESLNEGCDDAGKDWFEIVAVIRDGVKI